MKIRCSGFSIVFLLLSMLANIGDYLYGTRSMVVKGYQQFYKVYKFWFIQWTVYKSLMIVNDN